MELENGMKLLDSVINFGKKFQSLSQVGQYAVVIGLVFIAFNFGSCDGNKKIKEFVIKYEQLQSEAQSAKLFADSAKTTISSLTSQANAKDETIKKLTISVEFRDKERQKLKNNLSSLEEKLVAAKDTAEMMQIQEGIIFNLKDQLITADSTNSDLRKTIELQKYKITKLDSALVLANIRGDRLQIVVDSLVKLPSPKPPRQWISKKTLGAVAFVGGVLAGDYLARR